MVRFPDYGKILLGDIEGMDLSDYDSPYSDFDQPKPLRPRHALPELIQKDRQDRSLDAAAEYEREQMQRKISEQYPSVRSPQRRVSPIRDDENLTTHYRDLLEQRTGMDYGDLLEQRRRTGEDYDSGNDLEFLEDIEGEDMRMWEGKPPEITFDVGVIRQMLRMVEEGELELDPQDVEQLRVIDWEFRIENGEEFNNDMRLSPKNIQKLRMMEWEYQHFNEEIPNRMNPPSYREPDRSPPRWNSPAQGQVPIETI